MGLDTTHGAFNGAYSAFNRLRQAVCFAAGGSFPPHWQYNADGSLKEGSDGRVLYDAEKDQELIYMPDCATEGSGLREFLSHSDCDGEISPEMCSKVADDLEALLPAIEALGWEVGGHLARWGGYAGAVRRFVGGCRAAAAAGEALEFH